MTIPDRLSAALAGRYRIERERGAGGMATVYLAEDLKHDRKVAIKVLKPELAAVLATWPRVGIWMAIGLTIYFTYGRHHAKLATQTAAERAQVR